MRCKVRGFYGRKTSRYRQNVKNVNEDLTYSSHAGGYLASTPMSPTAAAMNTIAAALVISVTDVSTRKTLSQPAIMTIFQEQWGLLHSKEPATSSLSSNTSPNDGLIARTNYVLELISKQRTAFWAVAWGELISALSLSRNRAGPFSLLRRKNK